MTRFSSHIAAMVAAVALLGMGCDNGGGGAPGGGKGPQSLIEAFASGSTYPTGIGSAAVAIADVDGDRRADLIVAGRGVTILRNKGGAAFEEPVSYPSGGEGGPVSAADLNQDGHLDLVLPANNYGGAAVLMNRGDGTFAPAVNYAAARGTGPMALGDLSGDGYPDLVVPTDLTLADGPPTPGIVKVLINQGNGTFGDALTYEVGAGPRQVAISDLDGDGRNDLAVANISSTFVSVLLNRGQGSFAPMTVAAESSFGCIASGDVNGDGKLDLVLGRDGVGVLLNLGNGRFDALRFYPAGTGVFDLAVEDLNGDHRPDVAFVGLGELVGVLFSRADGSLTQPADYPVGVGPRTIAVGDLDGDGKPELAISNTASYDVTVLRNDGAGRFGPTGFAAGVSSVSMATADFNGDGLPDVATVDGDKDLAVLLSDRAGGFQTALHSAVGPGAKFVAAGDLNGDGKPDLVALNVLGGGAVSFGGSVSILMNGGDGQWGTATPVPTVALRYDNNDGAGPQSVAIADVNGDGMGDVIVANNGASSYSPVGDVSVLINLGGGAFAPAVAYLVLPDLGFGGAGEASDSRLVVADLNGDGWPDIALGGRAIGVALNRKDGTFAAATHYGVGTLGAVTLALGDMDGDGDPDLTFSQDEFDAFVGVLINDGTGSFAEPVPQPVASGSCVAVADIDRDGDLDLAVAYCRGFRNTATLLSNDGKGIFTRVGDLTVGAVTSLNLQDFNGDTKADLAAATVSAPSNVFLFLNHLQ